MMRRGRGAAEGSLKTSVIALCPVNSGDMAHRSSAESRVRVTAVQRGGDLGAPTAGLAGLATPWDVCMMRRGRRAVEGSLKISVIASCPVNSGDMASLECRLMG